MGNCGGKDQNATVERPGSGKMMVYGDFFSAETRTILVILKMSQVEHEVRIVDQFTGEHKAESYLNINPTGQIPTMTEGKFLVLGGY
jgi:glutathione S-transferase